MEQYEHSAFEGNKFVDKVSCEAKLKELLRNLSSTEIRLSSYASKEFITLLKADDSGGGLLLREYVLTSSNCSELLQAFKLGHCFFSLISTFLAHPDGIYKAKDTDPKRIVVSRALDRLARSITEQNLGDICKELNSKEAKNQKAALLLLASIVRRGSSLASDVAKSFDFKLPGFIKLAEYKHKKPVVKKKHSTRRSFVGFAMSFLEVGNPRLLRWVLQQRLMYSAVLRGIGDDDDETVVYILSTLRDRILVPQSLVPPGLRSVLFGSVTLEKLINISSRCGGDTAAAELAHSVLVSVCTDPSNGLMPDSTTPLRGNPKRLLDLMKKLKATEIEYHQNLLLAIVKGRPSLACLYMDEYPYNLEDHTSPSWFAAVSLTADLISSVGCASPFSFMELLDHPPSFNSSDVQCVMKCICPRPFTRLVMNKGLLHTNSLVKHRTLKLVLEVLKLLDTFLSTMEKKFGSDGQVKQRYMSLKIDIQNEARTFLPDPQVLFSLLSSLSRHYESPESCLKRKRGSKDVFEEGNNAAKKLKIEDANEDVDILVSGVALLPEIALPGDDAVVEEIKNLDDLNNMDDRMKVIADIWGLHQCSMPAVAAEDEETHFYSKLLDTLRFYYRTVPSALEGSFDFFKAIPHDPLALPIILQQCLLSLLVEVIGWSASSEVPSRIPLMLYKHLQTFIEMLLYSQSRDIKHQAYILAKAAILSTGAFTKNPREIDVWFLFLPSMNNFLIEDRGIKVLRKLSSVIVIFLCDAISTIGNSSFKYWDVVRHHMTHLNRLEDVSPEFSPLVVCVLEKCLRVLQSESGSFNLSEKTMISLYVCNTVKYILQTQVEAGLISLLIDRLLTKKVEEHCSSVDGAQDMCEWRPVMNLLLFSRGIENQKICKDSSPISRDSSFANVVSEVERVLSSGTDCGLVKVTKAFVLSLISTPPAVVLQQFPSVLCISRSLFGVPFSILLLIFSLEPNFMDEISNLWPDLFDTDMQWAAVGCHEEEIKEDTYSGSTKSASVAFFLFMRQASYQVLTPMILSISIPKLFEGPLLTTMLLDKLSDLSAEYTISLLRLLLFWGHRIWLSYPSKPLDLRESLFRLCLALMDQTSKVLFNPTDSDCKYTPVTILSQCMVEAAEIICSHPLVLLSIESLLENDKEFPKDISGTTLECFLLLTEKEMQYMNNVVFKFLPVFPENTLHFLFSHNSLIEVGDSLERYKKSSKALAKKVLVMFRDRFGNFTRTGDLKPLAPAFYALHKMINVISPHELFELVDWMFSRITVDDLVVHGSSGHSAMSFGLWITGCAFDMLSGWLEQQTRRGISSHIKLWPLKGMDFDLLLFEKVYFRIVDIATQFEMESADLCLLKALNVAKILKVGNVQCITLSLDLSKVILNTPTTLISHFISKTSRTRAKVLSSIINISPVHLSFCGPLLSDMMSKFVHLERNVTKGTYKDIISDDSCLMLLPAAVSYLNTTFVKHKEEEKKCFRDISSFYCTILLRNFSDWSNFVSGDLFRVEGDDDPRCLSVDDEIDLIYGSLLMNTIFMLQHHFTSSKDAPMKSKKRLNLFDSVCSEFNFLDRDITEVDVGVTLSLDAVNRTIARVHFCRMLLFPKANQIYLDVGPHKEDSSRISFMKMLVGTWDWIANKSFSSGYLRRTGLLNFLEAFLLKHILELTRAMGKHLIDHQLFTGLVEKLARSALLNRFDDPKTLMIIRRILASVPNNKVHMSVLQLLLAHSEFAPTIHYALKSNEKGSQFGVTVKPMASILRFLVIPSDNQNALDEERSQQLEVLKLLRLLFSTVIQQPGFNFSKDVGVNSQELLVLLLTSYGATSGKLDLEIYKLMTVLEYDKEVNSGIIAEMDFLWGSVAATIRKEQETPSNEVNDIDAIDERRRSRFREMLPIDPRMCANTVLNFPFYRTVGEETLQDNIPENIIEYPNDEKLYDPVYILRFSIHCLSTTYIEPMEFASLGLLAVAFISISSPDVELRKLGYEALGRFKTALEECQKRKDRARLRLLLMYIQNGIEESWQKIPTIIALFAAEASWVLLDPVHDHYSTISKLLMNSPRVNMKSIPLFQSLLRSNSITFKSDRLWILRLLYAGLNSDEDCQLYIRGNIIETLLSCYASLLSDDEAKGLILQVVKKSLKFHGMGRYLVENCGLISWLSSIVSFFNGIQFQDQRSLPMTMLVNVLEVINDAVECDDTLEWLEKFAFEQFSELSTHLYKLLVGGNLFQEQTNIVSSILKILTSTLKISQKRERYQTHYTLSAEAMFRIYETVNKCSDTAELGLKAVLMSAPPVAISDMGEEKLIKFLNWATSTAIQLDSAKARRRRGNDSLLLIWFDEEQSEEKSLISKLLRWLTASVILQRHSRVSLGFNFPLDRSEPKTLLSLLEYFKERGGLPMLGSGCEEILATNIFHLQLLLGTNYTLLPSVISALCLLQFPDLSQVTEMISLCDNQKDLSSICARIHCPVEVNPAWRWSFNQQWEDISSKDTDSEKLDELQACRSIFLTISNFLGNKKSLSHIISLEDLEKSGVFAWERSLLCDK